MPQLCSGSVDCIMTDYNDLFSMKKTIFGLVHDQCTTIKSHCHWRIFIFDDIKQPYHALFDEKVSTQHPKFVSKYFVLFMHKIQH